MSGEEIAELQAKVDTLGLDDQESDLGRILSKLQDNNLALKHQCSDAQNSPLAWQNPIFLTSKKSFDPSALASLSDLSAPSQAAGSTEPGYFKSSYTTIASNPGVFSLTSYFDDIPIVPDPQD